MIVFHYDSDPFRMDQWLYLVHLFRVKGWVLNVPVDVKLHRYVEPLESLSELDGPLIKVSRGGTPLPEYKGDGTFVFGPDDGTWTPDVEFDAVVSVPTPVDEDLYSFQAGAMVLYEKLSRG